MKKEPLVSLIIPVYNVMPYLRQSLDSAAAQSYGNLKIVIIDDGSTDGSGAVCDEYAGKYPNITVFHTENRGLSAARNFALDNMDPATEYVSFLDSDDWMEPDAVHTLCRAAEEEGADLVSCDYYIIADGKDKRPAFPSDSKVVLTGEERLIRFINRDRLNSMPWNKLYKSALFSDVRLPEDKYFGDSAVVYRLIALAEKVVLIPDILFDYRIRESSLTFNYSAKRLVDRWDVHLQRYKFLSALVTDEACIRILEGDCLVSIERMWKSWKNFGPEDRRLAKPCLEEMNRFASERRGRVLRERGYKKFHKLICLLAVFKDPRFVVPLLSTAFAVFNFLKKR